MNRQVNQRCLYKEIALYHNRNSFAGLLEFHQGSQMKVVWSINADSINPDLISYVGSFSANNLSFETPFSVNTIETKYENTSFIAIYFLILDIDARGFSRIGIFFISHDLISHEYSKDMISCVEKLQTHAFNGFLENIGPYAATLQSFARVDSPQKFIFEGKLNEMKAFFSKYPIDIGKYEPIASSTPDSICCINNNLRSFTDISNFSLFEGSFEDVFLKCIQTQCRVPSIIGPNPLSNYQFPDFDLEKSIVDSDIIIHSIFTLISGYKLIIVTPNPEKLKHLAFLLSFFIPNYSQENSCYITGLYETGVSHSIVLSTNIKEIPQKCTIIDFRTFNYYGLICEASSSIWNHAECIQKGFISSFLFNLFVPISSLLEKILYHKQTSKSSSEYHLYILQNFHHDDYPIIDNISSDIVVFNSKPFIGSFKFYE